MKLVELSARYDADRLRDVGPRCPMLWAPFPLGLLRRHCKVVIATRFLDDRAVEIVKQHNVRIILNIVPFAHHGSVKRAVRRETHSLFTFPQGTFSVIRVVRKWGVYVLCSTPQWSPCLKRHALLGSRINSAHRTRLEHDLVQNLPYCFPAH